MSLLVEYLSTPHMAKICLNSDTLQQTAINATTFL